MIKTRKWLVLASVALVVLILGVAALPAAADTRVTATAAHRGGPMGGVSDSYLAEALGLTTADLQTAQQKAYEAGIDKALAEGLITQAQADALKARSSQGRFDGPWLHGFLNDAATTIDPNALLADALGITTDELDTARAKAADLALAAAVEDGRLTQEQADQLKADQALRSYLDEQGYQTQVQALYKKLVQQAVDAGVITQAQADAIVASGSGMGMGRHGGRFGGPMGGMRGHGGMRNWQQSPDTTAPSGTRQSGNFGVGAFDF